MNSTDPLVSVIVLTFNAREFVERCLTSVFNQTYRNFEVVVVDNASSDGTAELVRERFPQARVICSVANDGYGAGNNLGVRHASGDILVFLNPDAVPERDWLRHLIDGMRQHGRRFATSRITLQSNSQRLNSGGNLIHFLGLSFCRGLNAPCSRFDQVELVSGASGAACAIGRDLFERIGGFDPSFFLYHDDVDLSARALLAGEPCLYVPQANVAHDYSLSVRPIKWGWVEAHRYAVLLKVFRVRTLLILLPALVATDVMTFAFLASRGPAYVAAKLRSYGWVVRHAGSINRNRRRAQAVRALSDREMLRVLADRIPYEQLAPAWLARMAARTVDPWFRLYKRVAVSLITW